MLHCSGRAQGAAVARPCHTGAGPAARTCTTKRPGDSLVQASM
jgi:hypothetical protein